MSKSPIANLFKNLPEDLSEEVFQELLKSDKFTVERIISLGQTSPEGFWYEQDQNEWVILLQGKAGLRFEDEDDARELSPGDYLNIPAGVRHRVEWTATGDRTIWLAIHY